MEQSFGPYLEIARIQSEMNKLFDVLLEVRDGDSESSVNSWIPSVDVCQVPEGLIVRCDLPGVPKETLRLAALSGALIVTGERPRSNPPPGQVKFTCMERTGGKFRRVVPLGTAINSRDARAMLREGVLEVFFPKVSNRRGEEVIIPVATPEDET
ncbi:MAG TPA: Hsp20/alpha crystallin family protein [Candidatus Polarisedimenticolia bacterium]|nr:Hsp20/alpha crystallin family protein [Candidatus Polarisedimenticolia bacterium]